MRKLCIYHGNCADGFGAACVVRKVLGEENVIFHPGVYQDPPPLADVYKRDVILVDFSYKRDVLLKIAERAASVLILDHHESAMEDLAGIEAEAKNIRATFDMEHSGAMLAWLHYYPGMNPPELLKHIEDRDLWRFNLPGTREIQAALFSYPYDFKVWENLLFGGITTDQLQQDGIAIERKHHKDIAEFIQVAMTRGTIAGYDVPILNAPYHWSSDAGHEMAKAEPFAACWWDTPEGRVFSLRSSPDGLNVKDIAVLFGGGGHAHAAGFRLPHEKLGVLANPRGIGGQSHAHGG